MRIECKRGKGGLFFTQALVKSPSLNTIALVRFYIDTGASSTIISEVEAKKNWIDYTRLKPSEPAIGIGDSVPVMLLEDCIIVFSGTTSVNIEKLPAIGVFKREEGNKKQSLTDMSLLGLDILIRFKIHFIGDGKNAIMVLEKEKDDNNNNDNNNKDVS